MNAQSFSAAAHSTQKDVGALRILRETSSEHCVETHGNASDLQCYRTFIHQYSLLSVIQLLPNSLQPDRT